MKINNFFLNDEESPQATKKTFNSGWSVAKTHCHVIEVLTNLQANAHEEAHVPTFSKITWKLEEQVRSLQSFKDMANERPWLVSFY